MDEYVVHANYNHDFYEKICSYHPDYYFDWKIICLFYTAIHFLKALAKHRAKKIGFSHFEINSNIRRGKHNPAMPISDTAFSNYMNLFHYSQTARYDGIEDMNAFNELRKRDHDHSLQCFRDFKKFIITSGVKMN
jgi:hypothetical protein